MDSAIPVCGTVSRVNVWAARSPGQSFGLSYEEIRDLNDKIFELEDGRLLQAIKNILKSGKSPNVAQEVKSELVKIDLGAAIRPGKKPKAVKGSIKPPKAAKVPVTVHLAASPVNPSPIGMPTSKTPPKQ